MAQFLMIDWAPAQKERVGPQSADLSILLAARQGRSAKYLIGPVLRAFRGF